VSTGTVARTLDAREIERAAPPVVRKPRRELPRRFERALANDLWQTDITSFVIGRSRLRVYLIVFLDDFSRFVVSHGLYVYQRGDIAKETLLIGIGRYGKPNEVLSDQGRQYFAWRGKAEFQKLLTKLGIHHAVARAHHPETVGKCERLWESVKREFVERVELEDLADARERIGHYFAHYNFFRPHQGIGGLVPADRYFGAQDALRKTHEARLVKDELGEALSSRARTRAYLFGQIGDEQVSVHGERGELVVHTSSGVRQRIALEDLGVSGAELASLASLASSADTTADTTDNTTGPDSSPLKNGRTAEETAKDADADKRNDGGPSQELAISGGAERERADNDAPPPSHGQEAAALPPSAGDASGRTGAVAERDERRAAECAPLVCADPGAVAGQADARGRGGELVAAAAAGVAIEPAGAGGDARGSVDPTQEPPWAAGVHDDMQSRRSAGVEQAHRGAFAQERGAGAAGASGGAAADAGGWAAGVFDERAELGERGEEARDAS
jgi:transposase InsO family protein